MNKKAQDQKIRNFPQLTSRKGQEEMVGFALIIVLVAVILLVFLGSSLKNSSDESVEDYMVSSFIQSFLQYTTSCEKNSEKLSIQEMIFECDKKTKCDSGEDSCELLSEVLEEIVEESWEVGENEFVKAYELEILYNGEEFALIKKGAETTNYRTSAQNFAKSGDFVEIFFTAYS